VGLDEDNIEKMTVVELKDFFLNEKASDLVKYSAQIDLYNNNLHLISIKFK
jgi:hypothetical protein